MKSTRFIAVILALTLPGEAFAQSYSAAQSAASAESGVAGAAATIPTVPALTLGSLPLSAPSLGGSFTPAPTVTPAALGLTAAAIPSAPAIRAAKVSAESPAPAALKPVKPAAAAPALKPALETALRPAADKSDSSAQKSWTEKISAMFDGAAAKKSADETPLEPANLKAFVVRHGSPMTEITLEQAAARGGQVRLLTAKNDPQGLTEKHAAKIGELLRSGGTVAKVQREQIAVDWSPKKAAPEQGPVAAASGPTSLGSKLLWPFREAKFLAKTFAASLVKPLPSEIVGGLATKSFPLATSIGVYWATVGLAHPFALAGLIALSVTQEVFHGFFLKSWNNFQESLRRARGFNYQMFFNLAYMQGFGTLYRVLSWTANPKSVTPPWSVHYWQDMAVMSVAGTFFGVLGYNSLNALYAKGSITRWQHSGIQQLRDLCFLLAAPFFASGSMTVFWAIFVFQQLLDLAISIWAGRARAREIVFVTSAAVAASAEFKDKYPAQGVKIEPPLKQAGRAVVDNPLVRLMTWPFRALWKVLKKWG